MIRQSRTLGEGINLTRPTEFKINRKRKFNSGRRPILFQLYFKLQANLGDALKSHVF